MQIWDTAGQEKFRTITSAYYKGAHGIIVVYDVTDQTSFDNIQGWFREIDKHAVENVNKIMIGNKADLNESRVISTEQGQQLANTLGVQFLETSAKESFNVAETFTLIAQEIKSKTATGAKVQNKVKLEKLAPGNVIKQKNICC